MNVKITLYEGGTFRAYSRAKSRQVIVGNKGISFSYNGDMITTAIPVIIKQPLMY